MNQQDSCKTQNSFYSPKILCLREYSTRGPPRGLFLNIVFSLYQLYIKGELVINIVHISGIQMIEDVIGGLYRGNSIGFIIRGIDTLPFYLWDKVQWRYLREWKHREGHGEGKVLPF